MMVYRLRVNALLAVDVSLDVIDPDAHAPLRFTAVPTEADPQQVDVLLEMIRDEVGAMTGVEGHLLGRVTTPADLHAAMSELTRYAPELRRGADIVASWRPEPTPPKTAR